MRAVRLPQAIILEVKRMRAELRRSPPRIAQELGLSLQTVQAILAGKAEPKEQN